MADPGIDIRPGERGLEIAQHRPAVPGLLTGMPLAEALQRIPTLLPVCGNAQGIAAARAAAAARGEAESQGGRHRQLLNREQALAAAWRLAIDWPALCEQPPLMDALKAIQRAGNAHSMANGLLAFVPGLDRVRDIDALTDWIGESDCLGAGILREAVYLESLQEPELHSTSPAALCAGPSLVARARDAFGAEPFDPLQPADAGIEVGPLAMGRHPLIAELRDNRGFGELSRRLAAQLLDTVSIAEALIDDQPGNIDNAWKLGEGIGLGRAMTARGPVFHRVRLVQKDDGPQVAQWRVLAPTDWHFAASGPLTRTFAGAGAAASGRGERNLKLLVAGFDPCAPCTIRGVAAPHA